MHANIVRGRHNIGIHTLFIVGAENLPAEAGIFCGVVNYFLVVAGVAQLGGQCTCNIVAVAAVLSAKYGL